MVNHDVNHGKSYVYYTIILSKMKEAGTIFSVLSDKMKTFATLTIKDLTKSFDKQHFANNHISLEIEAAKITAF